MTELEKYSDEQLEEELNRRNAPPKQLEDEDVDLTKLRSITEEFLGYLHVNNREIKDGTHYIYEEVMKTLYGPDIFYWINETME
jgi:hypothetical protein